MKVVFFSHVLAALMIPFVKANNQRLIGSIYVNDKIKTRTKTMGIRETDVRNKICNVKTCMKCFNVFATIFNVSEVSRKTIISCVTILKLRNCCPKKLLEMF